MVRVLNFKKLVEDSGGAFKQFTGDLTDSEIVEVDFTLNIKGIKIYSMPESGRLQLADISISESSYSNENIFTIV